MNDHNHDNGQDEYQAGSDSGAADKQDGAKKQASPGFKESPAQADGATFQIIGDAGPLFGALAAAQGAFLPIHKNRTVTVRPRDKAAYTFDYATLDQVLAACTPALSANGLALLQPFYHGPNGLELRTILAHSSGARLEAVTELPKVDSVQGAGSALTYLKRYQVQAILGVSSEEDDDGNAADGNQVQAMAPKGKPAAAPQRPPARATTPGKPPNKPQDAPALVQDPKGTQVAEVAPQPKSEPPPAPTELLATADKVAAMKKLMVPMQFKGASAKEAVSLLTGKDFAIITNPDVDVIVSVLEVATECKWDADRLVLLLRETQEPSAVIAAIREESDSLGGGL